MASETIRTPSERDLEIYRLTTAQGLTTRAIAEQMGISQTRVRQVNEQVLKWMGDVLPEGAAEMPEATRLLVAQQITTSRLDYLYGEAIAAWRASQVGESMVHQVREGFNGRSEVHTYRREQGNPRYLAAAMNISVKLGKLPAALPMAASQVAASPEHPLVGDCSNEPVEQGAESQRSTELINKTSVSANTCDNRLNKENVLSERLLNIFGPAQTAIQADREIAPAAAQPMRNEREQGAKRLASG